MVIYCPKCHASHYVERYRTSTAMYFPPVYKDGININPDRNITTVACTCLNCGHMFNFQEREGQVIT